MKKAFFTFFATTIVAANLFAQQPGENEREMKSPEERAERITKKMTDELALTADQQIKVKALILKREQERQERMKEEKIRREKMEAEMKTILTPEQFQKMESHKKEMMHKHRGNKKGPKHDE